MFSNYCGLGGSGDPVHGLDRLCKEHDEGYADIQSRGSNPYWIWNAADQHMLDELPYNEPKGVLENFAQHGANFYLHAKKYFSDYDKDKLNQGFKSSVDMPSRKSFSGRRPSRKSRKSYRSKKSVKAFVPMRRRQLVRSMRSAPRRRARSRHVRSGRTGVRSKGLRRLAKQIQIINSPLNNYTQVGKTQLTSSLNQCSYASASTVFCSPVDWSNCFAQIGASGAVITGQVIAESNASQLIVHRGLFKHRLANFGTVPVKVQEYWCKCRRDVPSSVYGTIIGILNNGYTSNGITNGGTDLTLTPFQSFDWCQYFKIMNVSTKLLQPGEVWSISHGFSKPFRVRKIDANSTSYLANRAPPTWVSLFRVEGSVAGDSGSATNVVIAASKVDIVTEERYEYTFTVDQTPSYVSTSTLGALVGNAEIINPDTDAVVAYTTA